MYMFLIYRMVRVKWNYLLLIHVLNYLIRVMNNLTSALGVFLQKFYFRATSPMSTWNCPRQSDPVLGQIHHSSAGNSNIGCMDHKLNRQRWFLGKEKKIRYLHVFSLSLTLWDIFISYMEIDKVTKCMKFYTSVKKKKKWKERYFTRCNPSDWHFPCFFQKNEF